MSRRPISAQREVCRQPWKAGTRCKQCRVRRVPEYRREDAAPARHRRFVADIRSSVHPRSFRQTKGFDLDRAGGQEIWVNKYISAPYAYRPDTETIRDTRPS